MGLDQQARFFPTPQSRDWKSGDPAKTATNARPLNEIAESFQNSPQGQAIHDGQQSSASAQTSAQPFLSHKPTELRLLKRRLNPRFVEWLMGLR